MLPPGFSDVATKGMYRIHETDSFIKLELENSGVTRASNIDEAGDVIMIGGILNGKSLDPLGINSTLPQKITNAQDQIRFYNNWLGEFIHNQKNSGFLGSIHTHFEKIYLPKNGKPPLDFVVIDYKYFDEISQAIGEDSIYFRNFIDNFIETNFQQYNNSNYLIKLNY